MKTRICLTVGADDNALACWVHQTIASNVSDDARARRDFFALRAAVAMVAQDRGLSTTLRFDHGYLTIHDAMVGIPDLTLCGDYEVLLGLADLKLSAWGRLPSFMPGRSAPLRRTALELVSGELKIYGMLSNARTLLRLLGLLGQRPG